MSDDLLSASLHLDTIERGEGHPQHRARICLSDQPQHKLSWEHSLIGGKTDINHPSL